MKRYKLLKDTPTLKAGTIFEEVVGDFDGLRALTRITPVGANTSPHFTIKDIDNFDEWFEEIPEKHERWRGGRGDSYYFIDDEGAIRHEIDTNDGMDNYRYNIGNYFKTEAEAESYKKYLTARQVLLDDAEGGKWVQGDSNWSVFYGGTIFVITNSTYYKPGIIYFQNIEALKSSLKKHKNNGRLCVNTKWERCNEEEQE